MTEPVSQPLALVADDDHEFREEIIPKALGKIRARILKAENVADACRVAAENPLEIVVLDMHMPLHKDTTELAKDGGIHFLKSVITAHCPVVVFTAYPNFRNCAAAIRAGAAAYLPKQSQDAYKEGREGGMDDLIATCTRLLAENNREEGAAPRVPDHGWLEENYEWLCDQFGGKWVAFLEPRKALEVGVDVEQRGTYGILASRSEDELRKTLGEKAVYLGSLPEILWVPNEPCYQ